MEIHIVITYDDGGHYGATMIDKVFIKKEEAEKYAEKKNKPKKDRAIERIKKGEKITENETVENPSGWKSYWVETHNAT
jgi:hypothetical protein